MKTFRVDKVTFQDLMNFGLRDQTPLPGIRASAGRDREQQGEATIKKMPNVDVERSFRETCAFFRGHSLYVGVFCFHGASGS